MNDANDGTDGRTTERTDAVDGIDRGTIRRGDAVATIGPARGPDGEWIDPGTPGIVVDVVAPSADSGPNARPTARVRFDGFDEPTDASPRGLRTFGPFPGGDGDVRVDRTPAGFAVVDVDADRVVGVGRTTNDARADAGGDDDPANVGTRLVPATATAVVGFRRFGGDAVGTIRSGPGAPPTAVVAA